MEQNNFNFDVVPNEEVGLRPTLRQAQGTATDPSTGSGHSDRRPTEVVSLRTTNDERRTTEVIAPHVYTVSEITSELRDIIENKYPDVWVTGEVSNLRNPLARNYYFVLKDAASQLNAVLFGGRQRLNFDLEDGLEVICHGKMALYAPRGDYQIIIDYCEPKGKGALQIAFEQLKKKLEQEGLFAAQRKRKLPYLPRKIGVITSPTGAAIRDIINVLTRRFPTIEILLIPVKVQGDGAAYEIAEAIVQMNKLDNNVDVMIVGRGGGSLEDLWAFNEEVVARAIFASRIPVVSAVGHEIDYTIADFVADVRAPTPSAAAELVVPEREELIERIIGFRRQLVFALKQGLQLKWSDIQKFRGRLISPSRRIPDFQIRLDGLMERLKFITEAKISQREQYVAKLESNLKHLSPMHILEKGYAVVNIKGKKGGYIKSAKSLAVGDAVDIRFYEGSVEASIEKVVGSR